MNQSVPEMVDHLFRHSSGRVVASLARKLGLGQLELAEDAFQEAVVMALRRWPYQGVPANPEAWLRRVAFNKALDVIRREGRKVDWDDSFELARAAPVEDLLSIMLVCCHPSLPESAQTALILRLVAGFSVAEIARAYLAKEPAIYQRLLRARQTIASAEDSGAVSDVWRSPERIDGLLTALYLLFNEGYAMTSGDRHVSQELCDEAIRLVRVVATWKGVDLPEVDALLALMLLQASRLAGRVGPYGEIRILAEQDRCLWDRSKIDEGLTWLQRSARGPKLTAYHLQAGIAALHCLAPTYAETDWTAILNQYDALCEIDGSSLVALNRAVALSMVEGPGAGLEALDTLLQSESLDRYALFHATVGELADRDGDRERAAASYARARALVTSLPEQKLLDQRLARYRHTRRTFLTAQNNEAHPQI